jgi:hypothetical protein
VCAGAVRTPVCPENPRGSRFRVRTCPEAEFERHGAGGGEDVVRESRTNGLGEESFLVVVIPLVHFGDQMTFKGASFGAAYLICS